VTLELSSLPKTWLLDVDGTILKHNGYKKGGDVLLEGVQEFFRGISKEDKIILLTSREEDQRDALEAFLRANSLRCDQIVCGLPYGERILVNDRKPSGLATAYSVNKQRDGALILPYEINKDL
jgi:hypothetical protein